MLPISVIIPVFNHEAYVEQCLLSVARGGTNPQEIILVDNASTDGSVDRAEALGLPNLVVVRNPENVGATKARHLAVSRAQCDLLCFLDSDDYLGPQALESAYASMEQSDLDVSLFHMVRVSEDGREVLFSLEAPPRALTGVEAFTLTLGGWRLNAGGVYRKSLYERAFTEFAFSGHSDDEILTRLLFLNADRVGGNSGTYYYRFVSKPPTMEMVLGQIRTNLRALELAGQRREQLQDDRGLRDMRNVVVRNLAGLLVRLLRSGGARGAFRELYEAYSAVPVAWTRGDAKFYLIDRAVAAAYLAVR